MPSTINIQYLTELHMELSGVPLLFVIVNVVALLSLPRRWAPMPLLMGACYMTLDSGIEIGPAHFTIIRMLIAAGILRVMLRGERIVGQTNGVDKLMLFWASWAIISSAFHRDPLAALIFRFGLVYNVCGIYFLIRVLCQSLNDVVRVCQITAIFLVPLSMAMLLEHSTGQNVFSALGAKEFSEVRNDKIRAQGPFAHPILAGTVGAVCLPLMIGLWRQHRATAVAGTAACLAMVFASSSSGPILSALFGVGALLMWHWRHRMRLLRWIAFLGYDRARSDHECAGLLFTRKDRPDREQYRMASGILDRHRIGTPFRMVVCRYRCDPTLDGIWRRLE